MKLTRFDQLGDVRLGATSIYLPARRVSTEELFAEQPELAQEMVRLTGIRNRFFASPEQATSDLAIEAARPLVDLAPIDRLYLATVSPDYPSPATAPLVQHGLGLSTCPSADLTAACAGFVYGLDAAARGVLTGDRAVLVVAAECRSRVLGEAKPGVRCLFGDGASAALVTPGGSGPRLLATLLGADGSGHSSVRVEAGGTRHPTTLQTVTDKLHTVRIEDGPAVFFSAVDGFVELAETLLKGLGLSIGDIDLVIPHQANGRILERVARQLRLPAGRLVMCVDEMGNVGGASVGIALHKTLQAGSLNPGARFMLLTAGAGYTMGAALLQMP